jgi:hypothetical protein
MDKKYPVEKMKKGRINGGRTRKKEDKNLRGMQKSHDLCC